jgi:hypothetical protein
VRGAAGIGVAALFLVAFVVLMVAAAWVAVAVAILK